MNPSPSGLPPQAPQQQPLWSSTQSGFFHRGWLSSAAGPGRQGNPPHQRASRWNSGGSGRQSVDEVAGTGAYSHQPAVIGVSLMLVGALWTALAIWYPFLHGIFGLVSVTPSKAYISLAIPAFAATSWLIFYFNWLSVKYFRLS